MLILRLLPRIARPASPGLDSPTSLFTLVGLGQGSLFLPELAGALVLPIPPILVFHGPADGSGKLSTTVPLPPLPPGLEGFNVWTQGAAVSAVGAAVLAAPSQLTIL